MDFIQLGVCRNKIYNFDIFELQAELIKRLKAGEVILGDGSYTVTLEKAGTWILLSIDGSQRIIWAIKKVF